MYKEICESLVENLSIHDLAKDSLEWQETWSI